MDSSAQPPFEPSCSGLNPFAEPYKPLPLYAMDPFAQTMDPSAQTMDPSAQTIDHYQPQPPYATYPSAQTSVHYQPTYEEYMCNRLKPVMSYLEQIGYPVAGFSASLYNSHDEPTQQMDGSWCLSGTKFESKNPIECELFGEIFVFRSESPIIVSHVDTTQAPKQIQAPTLVPAPEQTQAPALQISKMVDFPQFWYQEQASCSCIE